MRDAGNSRPFPLHFGRSFMAVRRKDADNRSKLAGRELTTLSPRSSVTHLVSRVPRHSRLSLVGSLQSPPASGDHE